MGILRIFMGISRKGVILGGLREKRLCLLYIFELWSLDEDIFKIYVKVKSF